MHWGVLIAVLIYEVVSIVGIGAFMAYKNKKSGGAESGSFAFAGGWPPPASLVGITLALTLLGSAHNWGTRQRCSIYGSYRCMVWYRTRNYDGSHHTDHRSMDPQNRSENHW